MPLRPIHAAQLWQHAAYDPWWPLRNRSETAFARYLEEMRAAEVLGYGRLRVAAAWSGETADVLGWVTWSVWPEDMAPGAGRVVEAGTYLVPAARGQGWNADIKRRQAAVAFQQLGAAWLVFLIPEDNRLARRAIEKLPWPWRVYREEEESPFRAGMARRRFATGQRLWLYAVARPDDRPGRA